MNRKAAVSRLKKRPEYLAVAKTNRKWVTPAFILQAMPGDIDSPPRIGFTVSKKVGNAVMRNKARRRLKEAATLIFPSKAQAGWAYVIVGRQASIAYPFEKLQADMKWALAKLAAGADLSSGRDKKRQGAQNPKQNQGRAKNDSER